MGNRAVITTENKNLAVYVHWNGGRDSVEAFLKYCELQRFREPECDSYGFARLCQVIANYIGNEGGGLSIGIDTLERLEESADWDNGVYIIKDWKIVGRERFEYHGEQHEYKLVDMLREINKAQPEKDRLSENVITMAKLEQEVT